MGRPPGSKNHEPRRVESPVRMTVAETIPPLEAVESDPEIVAMFPGGAIPAPVMDVAADPAVPEGVIANIGRPYHPMPTAPQDGTMVEARSEDGREFRMIWRRTSRYNARAAHWEYTGFWSDPFSRTRLAVEPAEWRPQEGFAMPGMVVT